MSPGLGTPVPTPFHYFRSPQSPSRTQPQTQILFASPRFFELKTLHEKLPSPTPTVTSDLEMLTSHRERFFVATSSSCDFLWNPGGGSGPQRSLCPASGPPTKQPHTLPTPLPLSGPREPHLCSVSGDLFREP